MALWEYDQLGVYIKTLQKLMLGNLRVLSLSWLTLKSLSNNPISRLVFIIPFLPLIIELFASVSSALEFGTNYLSNIERFGLSELSKNYKENGPVVALVKKYKFLYLALIGFSSIKARILFIELNIK